MKIVRKVNMGAQSLDISSNLFAPLVFISQATCLHTHGQLRVQCPSKVLKAVHFYARKVLNIGGNTSFTASVFCIEQQKSHSKKHGNMHVCERQG